MSLPFFEQHKNRIVGLDILRTAAILWVVYIKGKEFLPDSWRSNYLDMYPIQLNGVSIFFVLSGYIIGGMLLNIILSTSFNGKDLLHFWIRRWFRTIPNYMLILTSLLLIRWLLGWGWNGFDWRYYFFSQNIFNPPAGFFTESWSLTVEEWFYVLFPLIFFIFLKVSKNKIRTFIAVILLFLILPTLYRILNYSPNVQYIQIPVLGVEPFYAIAFLRFDSMMFGVAGALIQHCYPEKWRKWKYVSLAIGFLFLILIKTHNELFHIYPPLFYNWEAIITLFFIPYLSCLNTTGFKYADRFFIFISVISYSLYLLNRSIVSLIVIPNLDRVLGLKSLSLDQTWLIRYPLYWFLSITGSYLLYSYFEAPVTKLRDRFAKRSFPKPFV